VGEWWAFGQTLWWCGFVGILAQSGGFFLHMVKGQPDRASIGTTVSAIGAMILTCAIAVLVYGLFTVH
jgi:tellurite resistance protein TehA-like permease